MRASVGIERNLGSGARLRLDYSYERWAGLLRSANLNPPAPDGTRPDPRFGNVLEIVSAGRSRRHTLHLNGVWLRPGGGRSLVLSYVLGHARDDGDGPTSVPATAAGLEGEWGPARTDVRHRLFGFARSDLGGGFSAAAMARYESGAPYDLVTGADGNRDGILGDRPEGTGRHAARGQGRVNVDARLSWSRGFGPPRAPRGPQARVVRLGDGEMPDLAGAPEGRYQLSLYVQAFNLANRTNPLRHSGVLTSPYFGRPLEADPGRRIELGAGFAF